MDKLLVDTNIVSYLMKRHSISELYLPHLKDKVLCLSFVTIGELYLGAEKDNWGEKRKNELEEKLKNYVVLPYDKIVAECYARAVIGIQRQKLSISFPDAWIAATALAFEIPLVTHNGRHFINVPGLKVITETQEGGTSEKPEADLRP
ncbi:MAG: type II toxin-antitoxin system VapC family toxin [Bdellovibrionota bacterium]